MKHTKYILILLLSIIFLSCRKEDNEPDFTEKTVFMYLPWSTNLTSYFYDNITDLEKAIAEKGLEQEKVIVFMSTSSSEAEMFEIVYNKGICKRNILKEYTNPQFTTETGLTDIISDMKSFAPAESYSMIIGCHGMGSGGLFIIAHKRNIQIPLGIHRKTYDTIFRRLVCGIPDRHYNISPKHIEQ